MNRIKTTLIATLLIGTLGAGVFTTTAMARDHRQGFGPGGGFPVAGKICSENGGQRFGNMLTHAAERIDLTDEQTTSFETFKAVAISAQATVVEVCTELALEKDADLIDRLNFRQAIMAAQLDAMTKTMPALEEFYESLSEEQKAQLRPGGFRGKTGQHGQRHDNPRGGQHDGDNQSNQDTENNTDQT